MTRVLFVGGQYHGQMLPLCEASLAEAGRAVDATLRPAPEDPAYVGYYLSRVQLAAGGCRLLAIHRSSRETPERLMRRLVDAFSAALDNYERCLRQYQSHKRLTPLNATLPDDPGQPAKRVSTRADGGE